MRNRRLLRLLTPVLTVIVVAVTAASGTALYERHGTNRSTPVPLATSTSPSTSMVTTQAINKYQAVAEQADECFSEISLGQTDPVGCPDEVRTAISDAASQTSDDVATQVKQAYSAGVEAQAGRDSFTTTTECVR